MMDDSVSQKSVEPVNLEDIPEIWKWTLNQNIRPHCTRLVPNGGGMMNFNPLMPTLQEFKTLFSRIAEIENRENHNILFPNAFGCIKWHMSCFINALGGVHNIVFHHSFISCSVRILLSQIDECANLFTYQCFVNISINRCIKYQNFEWSFPCSPYFFKFPFHAPCYIKIF